MSIQEPAASALWTEGPRQLRKGIEEAQRPDPGDQWWYREEQPVPWWQEIRDSLFALFGSNDSGSLPEKQLGGRQAADHASLATESTADEPPSTDAPDHRLF